MWILNIVFWRKTELNNDMTNKLKIDSGFQKSNKMIQINLEIGHRTVSMFQMFEIFQTANPKSKVK